MRPTRVTGEAAVPDAVDRLFRKFEYPRDAVFPSPPIIGGGGGAPTIVVAASDSSSWSQSKADFICSGSDDHVVIQQAVDALNAEAVSGTTGGRIILCEGRFSIATDQIDIGEDIHLYGLGSYITELHTTATSGALIKTGNNCEVAGINFTPATISTCTGVEVNGDTTTVTRNHFNQLAVGVDLTQAGGGNESLIAHNRTTGAVIFVDGGAAADVIVANNLRGQIIQVAAGATNWTVTGNQKWRGQINFDQVVGVVIAGNEWDTTINGALAAVVNLSGCESGVVADNNIPDAVGYDGVTLDTCTGVKVTGNLLAGAFHGVTVDTSTGCSVDGNTLGGVNSLFGHGVQVIDSSHNNVVGNLILSPGADANNTYDGVILSGNSDQNNVQANKISGAAAGNEPRYGVNVSAATCDNNVSNANMAGPAAGFGTGAFNNAGTGTQGTNFTT